MCWKTEDKKFVIVWTVIDSYGTYLWRVREKLMLNLILQWEALKVKHFFFSGCKCNSSLCFIALQPENSHHTPLPVCVMTSHPAMNNDYTAVCVPLLAACVCAHMRPKDNDHTAVCDPLPVFCVCVRHAWCADVCRWLRVRSKPPVKVQSRPLNTG